MTKVRGGDWIYTGGESHSSFCFGSRHEDAVDGV